MSPEEIKRLERAQADYQHMQVTALAPFLFDVMTDGDPDRRYRVDLVEPSCTCPDFQQREIKCKHIWRVELEGYERPEGHIKKPSGKTKNPGTLSDPDALKPKNRIPFFDAREEMFSGSTLKELYCYGAPGKKKDYKFWVGIPNFPRVGMLTLCWGDFNEQELRQGGRHLGQSKEIVCQSPFNEAHKRGFQKLDKGYAPLPFELEELLLDQLATQFAAKGYNLQKANPDAKETKPTSKAIDWKPKNRRAFF